LQNLKNSVKNEDNSYHYENDSDFNQKKNELNDMLEEERQLDEWTLKLKDDLFAMAKDPVYAEFAYMTFDDIKQICGDSKDTLIAVKAPIGSKIEIPDPE
jgi:transcription factor E2F3